MYEGRRKRHCCAKGSVALLTGVGRLGGEKLTLETVGRLIPEVSEATPKAATDGIGLLRSRRPRERGVLRFRGVVRHLVTRRLRVGGRKRSRYQSLSRAVHGERLTEGRTTTTLRGEDEEVEEGRLWGLSVGGATSSLQWARVGLF